MITGRSIADVTDTWPAWSEVLETLTLRAGWNTTIVIVGTTLLGLAAGVVGVFALLRKRSLMADALSHATLPGIGLAFLAAGALGLEGRSLPVLLAGATISGVAGVLCIQGLLRYTRLREDAAIGIVLSVFFGAGVVVLSWIQRNAPSGAAGLNTFIYGQTAAMSVADARLMAGIAFAAILLPVGLMKEFAVVCFNDAFARVDGWPVTMIDLLMMALVVVVTVAGLQAVGLLLVVAMLIIPAVAARFWTERLWLLLVLAGVIGAGCGYLGASMSALLPRKPAGAVIVLTAGVVFLLSMLAAPARGVIATTIRRERLRLRIAGEHVLEAAHDHGPGAGAGAGGNDADADADADAPPRLPARELARLVEVRGWPGWFRWLVMTSLRRGGRIQVVGGDVVLTPYGVRDGARVSRNHQLWEEYLVHHADIAPSHVDWSVDQVEHVLSEELVARLERTLAGRGIVIPAAGGAAGNPAARPAGGPAS
jgi:manganese/zinc/iron transport system permease protein